MISTISLTFKYQAPLLKSRIASIFLRSHWASQS